MTTYTDRQKACSDAIQALFQPWPAGELGPTDEPESQYRFGYNTALEDALAAVEKSITAFSEPAGAGDVRGLPNADEIMQLLTPREKTFVSPESVIAVLKLCNVALAAPSQPAAPADDKCATCNGHGMIGGPSYYAPDEGGDPCPDCAAQATAPDDETLTARAAVTSVLCGGKDTHERSAIILKALRNTVDECNCAQATAAQGATRECGNGDCKWSGPTSDTVQMKHGFPNLLCPECYEVTEAALADTSEDGELTFDQWWETREANIGMSTYEATKLAWKASRASIPDFPAAAAKPVSVDAPTAAVDGVTDEPPNWRTDVSKWLRGEAGRHMASMRVGKGATLDSHALHLRMWADLIEHRASMPERKADDYEALRGVSDEYNAWIRYHAAAEGDFDSFLAERLATPAIDSATPNETGWAE